MKKSVHALLLIVLTASLLFIRCDCCINCPSGDLDLWLISPEDGAIIYTDRVTLKWGSEFVNITEYELGIIIMDESGDFSLGTHITEYDSIFEVFPLEPSTWYEWGIWGTYSYYEDHYEHGATIEEVRWFLTADVLWESGHVHSPAPDSGATLVSVNPHFAWEVYNPELLGFDFDIYLGTTIDPPLLVSGLSGPSYNLSGAPLDNETLYYWRVEAYYLADTVVGPLWEFTTIGSSDLNVFALLEIDAKLAPSVGYHVEEEFRARLDTGLAIAGPIEPLQADSVFVEGMRLNWNAGSQSYAYTEYSFPIIENGQPADFVVYGNSEVPDLNTGIVFPACSLGITSPVSFGTVSINGFEVQWDGSECGGTVWLTIMDGTDSTGVWKETDNDGIDTLTASDLQPLGGQTGTYNLIILKQVEENIDSPGYMPESVIRVRAINVMEQIHIYDI
jgi:hypothetical protein